MATEYKKDCVFCKYAVNSSKPEINNEIIWQNDEFFVINDHRPAARFHYLIIPKTHMGPLTEVLKDNDPEKNAEFFAKMGSISVHLIGRHLLPEAIVGFHVPPFNSIDHLHCHVIIPPYRRWWHSFMYHYSFNFTPLTLVRLQLPRLSKWRSQSDALKLEKDKLNNLTEYHRFMNKNGQLNFTIIFVFIFMPNIDLPLDIREKLQDLELELRVGDITLQGYEKKKASLMASLSSRDENIGHDRMNYKSPENKEKYYTNGKEQEDDFKQLNALEEKEENNNETLKSQEYNTFVEIKGNKRTDSYKYMSLYSNTWLDRYGPKKVVDENWENKSIDNLTDVTIHSNVYGGSLRDELSNTLMQNFTTIAAMLRFRAYQMGDKECVTVSGKSIESITYGKLNSKAERISQAIKDKQKYKKGDKVILLFDESEMIEYFVGIFSCLYAGLVIVILAKNELLPDVIDRTSCKLIVTCDSQYKLVMKEKKNFPFDVEICRISDLGNVNLKRNGLESLITCESSDNAIIECFEMNNEIISTCVDHDCIMKQCYSLKEIFGIEHSDVIINCLNGFDGIGLLTGIFLSLYNGCLVVFSSKNHVKAIHKCKGTFLLTNEYLLKQTLNEEIFKSLNLSNFRGILLCQGKHQELIEESCKFLKTHGAIYDDLVFPFFIVKEIGNVLLSARPCRSKLGVKRENDRFGQPLNVKEIINYSNCFSVILPLGLIPPNVEIIILNSLKKSCKHNEIGELYILLNQNENSSSFDAIKVENKTFVQTFIIGYIHQGNFYYIGDLFDQIHQNKCTFYGKQISEFLNHEISKIEKCGAFSIFINSEEYPIVISEVDERLKEEELKAICNSIILVLNEKLSLQVFMSILCPINTLPVGKYDVLDIYRIKAMFESSNLNPLMITTNNKTKTFNKVQGEFFTRQSESNNPALIAIPCVVNGTNLDSTNFIDLLKNRMSNNKNTFLFESAFNNPIKDVKKIDYETFYSKICSVCFYLEKKGLKSGDQILVLLPHSVEFVVAIYSGLGTILLSIYCWEEGVNNQLM
ncbi:Histidine triad (HIT) protein domain-containing protein [Rozella allomycis CSF55]|uniref:Histidine triad (HIT) protein domain-containing protein n=1 Tax=Rozella allomycis (strain CSF55) TaxID=988480 RepID=A0A075B521_ROZAC|nr:Histidine triad (HIT) protein domain-containing protein [Rozella allomycis CSF55]|eukprot:EPZ36663.1 Histidine triad (HIT) protein domain-containing protein [Rozella allomycis CSF55]